MIAYNKEWLENNELQEAVTNAATEQFISQSEKDAAIKANPVGFYTPNIFIRIGLFILTVIIVSLSFGFFALIFLSSSNAYETAAGGLCIFFGIVSYAALEWMVKNKNHYCSGVDDGLLCMSAILFVSGINLVSNISALGNAIIILMMAIYLVVRFADRLMALAAVIALLAVIFYILAPLGDIAKAITPFALMIIAAILYFSVKKLSAIHEYKNYLACFEVMTVSALSAFYAAGNYFVVREASIEFFNLQLGQEQSIPFGWLFWVFTVFIPLVYIARGIQKKDAVLLRTGVLLIAAIVFTIRYYHHVLPAETAMIIGGLLLSVIAYALMKFLKEPRAGFTSTELIIDNNNAFQNIEAIIIAETLAGREQPVPGANFGGGSFGGAGASDEF